MCPVHALPLEVLDATSRAIAGEEHSRGKCIELDVQSVTLARLRLQHPLARTDAPAARGGQGRVADALEALAPPEACIWIAQAAQPTQTAQPRVAQGADEGARGFRDCRHHLLVVQRLDGNGPFRAEPAVPPVSGGVDADKP